MDNMIFENLIKQCKGALERFVYYKMPSKQEAEDILQEIFLTSFNQFDSLKNVDCFKPWILRIASNKCNDFYRKRAKQLEIPLAEITENVLTQSIHGTTVQETTVQETVRETLDTLDNKDKQILYLYYFKNKPQKEISKILNIPIGTVKSRLYKAKQNFKK